MWASDSDSLGCGMGLLTLYSFGTYLVEGCLWQMQMVLIKYETRKWALCSLSGPCHSSLDIKITMSRSWGRVWVRYESVQDSGETDLLEGLSSPHHLHWNGTTPPPSWVSCQSEIWVIIKAQTHKSSGCFKEPQKRKEGFPCLPTTVDWEGRLSS
jgi:hypothetical protein